MLFRAAPLLPRAPAIKPQLLQRTWETSALASFAACHRRTKISDGQFMPMHTTCAATCAPVTTSDTELVESSSDFTVSQDVVDAAEASKAQRKQLLETGTLRLYDYQKAAIHAVLQGYQEGYTRQLVAMATGAGKTFTFSYLASLLGVRTLILVHRSELVEQTVRTLAQLGHEEDVGVLKGKTKHIHKPIVVATIQSATQAKTMQHLQAQNFQLCVVDEAHHATASTWMACMLHLGFIDQKVHDEVRSAGRRRTSPQGTEDSGSPSPRSPSPSVSEADTPDAPSLTGMVTTTGTPVRNTDTTDELGTSSGEEDSLSAAQDGLLTSYSFETQRYQWPPSTKLLLGVTATPFRNDHKRALKYLFEQQAFGVDIEHLIYLGRLCKVIGHRVLTYTDISKVKVTGKADGIADFVAKELSQIVNTPSRNQLVVDTFKSVAVLPGGAYRQTIAFCCDIDHAEALAEMFRENGVAAECVSSDCSDDQRRELLRKHKAGQLTVLTNVGILTEGYDDPNVACVLMTRPTKSTGLYTQSVGRGLRTNPGKEDCLIVDFTDRTHKLDKDSDLLSLEMLMQPGEGVELRQYNPPPPRVEPEIKLLQEGGVMKLYGKQKLAWVPLGKDLWLKLTDWIARKPAYYIKRGSYSASASGAPAEPVWVHLQSEPTEPSPQEGKGKQKGSKAKEAEPGRRYRLRVARGKDMPPEDSPLWRHTQLTPSPDPRPGRKSGSQSLIEEALEDRAYRERTVAAGRPDGAPAVEELVPPPVSVVAEAEQVLTRMAIRGELGLTPGLVQGAHKLAKKGQATPSQTELLRSKTASWRLFPDAKSIPSDLTKNEASSFISLGILYEAYAKANPDRVPLSLSGPPPHPSVPSPRAHSSPALPNQPAPVIETQNQPAQLEPTTTAPNKGEAKSLTPWQMAMANLYPHYSQSKSTTEDNPAVSPDQTPVELEELSGPGPVESTPLSDSPTKPFALDPGMQHDGPGEQTSTPQAAEQHQLETTQGLESTLQPVPPDFSTPASTPSSEMRVRRKRAKAASSEDERVIQSAGSPADNLASSPAGIPTSAFEGLSEQTPELAPDDKVKAGRKGKGKAATAGKQKRKGKETATLEATV